MSTVASFISGIPPDSAIGEMRQVQWTLSAGDDGAPVSLAEFTDRSVQFTGTFGGASVALQGSNDLTSPTNWFPLTDYQGNDISKSAAALEGIAEPTVWVRPLVTGGSGTTIVATLAARRSRTR